MPSGFHFEGRRPVAAPGKRRIYSNEGLISSVVLRRVEWGSLSAWTVSTAEWSAWTSSPVHGAASAADVSLFGAELARPTLVTRRWPPSRDSPQLRRSPASCLRLWAFLPRPWGLA